MIRRFVFALLCALILPISCMREAETSTESYEEMLPSTGLLAMTEQRSPTRTVIENGTDIYWEPGDEIAVFWKGRSGRFTTDLPSPDATATFHGSLTGWEEGDVIWAVYPYSEDAVFSGEGFKATLPARQTARAGSFAPWMNLSVARSDSRVLQFYNVGGGVRFKLTEDGVRKVVLEGLDGEILAGTFKIAFDNGLPVIREVSEGSRYITILPSEGESFRKGAWYYITALPTILSKGFRLMFYKEKVYATLTRESPVTIKRAVFGSLEDADAGLEYKPLPDLEEWSTETTLRGVHYEEEPQGADDGDVVKMPPDALFVMDDLNKLLVNYDENASQITYKDGDALTEADIKVGDVLYSMPVENVAPEGYILRVTGVSRQGDKLVCDVEPAGLADAFEELVTTIPLSEAPLNEDCFSVFDPFKQVEKEEQASSPMIRQQSLMDDLKYERDKWSVELDREKKEATLSIVLVDGDDKLKTKDDQLRLLIKLEYDLDDIDVSFKNFNLSGRGEPQLGLSASLVYKDDSFHELTSGDLQTQKERKSRMREMEKKLVGKKIKIGRVEIPITPACKILCTARIDLYVFFSLSLDGELEVSVGIEKTPISFSFGNQENDCTTLDNNKTYLHFDPTPYYSVFAECDLKTSAGFGAGLIIGLSRILTTITYEPEKDPYFGLFWEYSAHFDAKVKYGYKNEYSGDNKYSLNVTADAYTENNLYLEGDINFNNKLIFNFRYDMWKIRIPEKGQYLYEKSFEYTPNYPTAVCVSPENGDVAHPGEVQLVWDVPSPVILDNLIHFHGLSYDVYASTDRNAVEACREEARVASRITDKTLSVHTGQDIRTWYWRVVVNNSMNYQFPSPVFRFDTGYDGEIKLTQSLINYLTDNPGTIPELRILKRGKLLRTPSNLAALQSAEELSISDPENTYGVDDIDPILAEMPNLKELVCIDNTLMRSIDLSDNRRLESISVRDNNLTALDLRGLSSLRIINCSGNSRIKALDISGCPALKTLNCAGCSVSQLNLGNNPHLVELYASGNNLSTLDITNCPQLIRLDVYSQSTELLTLHLTHIQMNGFAQFKRHFNMAFEFVENLVTWEPVAVTQKSATIPATVRGKGEILQCGMLYYPEERELTLSNSHVVYAHNLDGGYYTVTLEGLRPATEYFVRGFAVISGDGVYYGNTERFKTLSGDELPQMTVSPTYLDFGAVSAGESVTKRFSVYNDGDAPLVFHLEGCSGPFSWSPEGEMSVDPLGSQEVYVTFSPSGEGSWDDYLTIVSNATPEPFKFSVSGYCRGAGVSDNAAIDLGLPSGVKWASYDVGAERYDEAGTLFAWGELEAKNYYTERNYRWADDGEFTKYCFDPASGKDGYVDRKAILELDDDVAHVKWGGIWHIPSPEEWVELREACEWSCETIGEKVFVKGVSKANGAVIYFHLDDYWSSSLYSSFREDYSNSLATYYGFKIRSDNNPSCFKGNQYRYKGNYVRPVMGVVNDVVLDQNTMSIHEGECRPLRASVVPDTAPNRSIKWYSNDTSVVFVSPQGTVIGLAPGSATVIASSVEGNIQSRCEVNVLPGGSRSHVNLGLSVEWASCDIGSSGVLNCGTRYKWAETEPYVEGKDYKWVRGGEYSKYSRYDLKTELELSDDATHVAWGASWRTPSLQEWQELLANCDVYSIEIPNRNVSVFELVSRVNGNVIFIPSAGTRYMTSSLFENKYERIHGYDVCHGKIEEYSIGLVRDWELSVRAVYDRNCIIPAKGIFLDTDQLTMYVGGSNSLVARVVPNNATNQRILWSSSNPSVVTVSSDGRLKAMGEGTAVITATTSDGGYSAQCSISTHPAPEAVDMGLSVRWASYDVGSTDSSSRGSSYYWGEVFSKSRDLARGMPYTWYLVDNYITPGKTFLKPEDDVARIALGDNWRTPTKEEWEELLNNCTWKKASAYIREAKSNITGNSIYLYYNGYYSCYMTNELSGNQNNSSGYACWSFNYALNDEIQEYSCSYGFWVRGVCK